MVLVQRFAILMLCLLAVPLALGAYSIDIQEMNAEVYRNETATFVITVTNYEPTDARFQVYTIDPTWRIDTVPITLFVPAGGKDTMILRLRPSSETNYGAQGVPLTFKNLAPEGGIIKKDIVVTLRNDQAPNRQYEPTVLLDVRMPYDVDPREQVPLRLEMTNRNALNISGLSVHISSPHFVRDDVLDLGPLAEKTRDIQGIILDPLTAPGEAEIRVELRYQDRLVGERTKNYRIIEYTTIAQDVQEDKGLFRTTKSITITNDGNVANNAVISIPTSIIKRFFISSDTTYERVTAPEGPVVQWRVPLAPDESATIVYVENYRVLILLVIVIILAYIAYWLVRSPLVVRKEAVGIVRSDESVSQLKVRIMLRNRSARMIRDLQVTDKVPSLIEVVKAEAPGSITPSKIAVNDKQGTLLRWQIDVLEPYEERVVTYLAKSKLKIIGKMSLPQAKSRFLVRGKERVIFSNNIELVERFRDR